MVLTSRKQHSDDSPGRFFAVNEIKMMLAWTLLNYDFKTKDGKRPATREFLMTKVPDTKAQLLFKQRSDLSI
jgi:hypothetical protein